MILPLFDPANSEPRLSVQSFGMTAQGNPPSRNQDQFLIAVLFDALQVERSSLPQRDFQFCSDRSHLFLVAGGAGSGGAEGDGCPASGALETFVQETFNWFAHGDGGEQDSMLAELQHALSQAYELILAESVDQPGPSGTGLTLTLALSLDDELFVAHKGGSRCYLLRDANLYRLTRDGALEEDKVHRAIVPAAGSTGVRWREPAVPAARSIPREFVNEVTKFHLEDDDRLLLCSDGLTAMVPDERISTVLATMNGPEEACRELIARANEAGGNDNLTVVVAQFRMAVEHSLPSLGIALEEPVML